MRSAQNRRVLIVADAVFGAALLLFAFSGALSGLLPRDQAASAPAPVEVVARFGGLMPPGQTTGLAVAADGSLAVVDRGRKLVLHLDANGHPLAEWGPRFGNGLEANDLLGLAATGDGWFVLDRGAQRILRLDANGRAQPDLTIDLQPLATYGPNGLATDSGGRLYVADTGRDRVLTFDPNGRLINSVGDSGTGPGQLKQPMALAVADDGTLYISDWENSRVARWDPDGEPGTTWPLPSHAWGIATDAAGRVYVPDGDGRLVRVFDGHGDLLFQIEHLPIDGPSQVAVAADGNALFVLGSDGLARADLSGYAAILPSQSPEPVRVPLAVLGAVLLMGAAFAGFAKIPLAAPGSPATSGTPTSPASAASSASSALLTLGKSSSPGVGGWAARADAPRWLRPVGLVIFVLASIGAIVAALRLLDPLAQADPWPRLLTLVLTALLAAAGITLSARAVPLVWVRADWPESLGLSPAQPQRWTSIAIVVAVVCCILAAAIWWVARFQTAEATRGALLWLTAIAAVALVTAKFGLRVTIWTLVPWLLFALALAPRLWDNANLPFGVWFDEAEAGLEARRYLQEGRYTPITDAFGRDASLFYYGISAAMLAIRDPVVAGRAVAAVVGAANAPLLYLLGRELFGWRVGLLAGVLIAASRWHLNVSRLGWDPISLPVCATLAFWLLARAVRSQRTSDFTWAGMAFGLGLHGYIGFRGMPIVALVLLGFAALRQHWPGPLVLRATGVFAAGLVLVALPVLVFAVQDPAAFNGRLGQTAIFSQEGTQAQKLADLWSNVQKHALMFNVSGDTNGRHNIPGWPMLDPASGVLYLVGLCWLALRPLDWRSWLVAGWAVVALAGGILTLPFEAPQGMRTLALTPLLAMLAGLGLLLVLDRVVVLLRGQTRTVAVAAATAGLAIALANVSTFFGRQMTDPTVWESFSTRATLPARFAQQAGGRYEAILGSATLAPSIEAALMVPGQRDRIRAFDPVLDLPYRGAGPGLVVLDTEHDDALADEVARYHPAASVSPIVPPNGSKSTARQILLEPSALAESRGIPATYIGADGATVQRREPTAAVDVPVATPADVAWRFGLAVDAPGVYEFLPPDGLALLIDGLSTRRAELARGNHVLELRGTAVTPSIELRWRPPNGELQPIDRRALFVPPLGGNGLQATFFPSERFSGEPREELIDPLVSHYFHTNPFARLNVNPRDRWSAEWRGVLDVPTSGIYRFEAERVGRAGLWLDDTLVFDETLPDAPERTAGTVELPAGRHDIRVRFVTRGEGGPRLYLFWTPPGATRQVIPGQALYPPPPR